MKKCTCWSRIYAQDKAIRGNGQNGRQGGETKEKKPKVGVSPEVTFLVREFEVAQGTRPPETSPKQKNVCHIGIHVNFSSMFKIYPPE